MLDRTHLASLDDQALLQSLKAVAARANQITALLLAHLAEVEARGAYRLWSCPTLQAYCTYELRLSEDEAWRRCRAARMARQFPRLLDMLADASLHLTGLLLVGPHLTPENASERLGRVAFRSKREIERILAEIAPRPDVPAIVQPLGPAGDGVPRRAPGGWTAQVRGIAGFERRLPPGVGPGDAPAVPAEERDELAALNREADPEPHCEANDADAAHLPGEAPPVAPVVTSPLRDRVQVTADQAFVDLLSEARDLLWHQLPHGDLASVQRLALEALVARLRRRKYAATQPQASARSAAPERNIAGSAAPERRKETDSAPARATRSPTPAQLGDPQAHAPARRSPRPPDAAAPDVGELESVSPAPARPTAKAPTTPAPASPERQNPQATAVTAPARASAPRPHLPAAVRREVWQRDGARCTLIDERGVRCRATAALEFHHAHAHAMGGPSTSANLTLRCAAHNRLAAEHDFGAEHMAVRVAHARGLGGGAT
jgi:5-methylcytosine-specific restriction endonuclease McrA